LTSQQKTASSTARRGQWYKISIWVPN
jgi:hypothetical protein